MGLVQLFLKVLSIIKKKSKFLLFKLEVIESELYFGFPQRLCNFFVYKKSLDKFKI